MFARIFGQCMLTFCISAFASSGAAASKGHGIKYGGSPKPASTALITIADITFFSAFENMLVACYRYFGIPPMVVALDPATADYFRSHEVEVVQPVLSPHPRDAPLRKNMRNDMTLYETISLLLHSGIRVVYFDLDVFWNRNLLEFFDPGMDLMWEGHTYDPLLNMGFFIASPASALLFYRLMWWLLVAVSDEQIDECLHLDVFVLDYAVRSLQDQMKSTYRKLEGHPVCNNFTADQLQHLRVPLRWNYLPIRSFLHYTAPPDNITSNRYIRINPGDVKLALVHLWGVSGSPDSRMVLACMMGFWASNRRPPVSLPLIPCQWCKDGWIETLGQELFDLCTNER